MSNGHVEVWYDEFSLELGDSIRRSIDAGLRQSRFGVVVLSPAFFNKQWPQYELDGLTEVEMRGRDKVVLPIWHGVSREDVVSQSPSLANRKSISSVAGIEAVVAAIMRVVRPQGSPLVAARDLLLEWGVTPPVITDPYWLEVTEASNRADAFGATVPENSVWG
ncbi:MAG: toll/interleukin-1 receptor domain-containing protein, partial [Firmicutes bacterium]|nr:toll/interleukin-1 receptor domain-containing protein [Bacillota bacterium]